MNKSICYTLAKLLKEKGFDVPCREGWVNYLVSFTGETRMPDDESNLVIDKLGNRHLIERPTISDVVMWLYEKYGIWIMVNNWYEHVLDNDDNILDKTHLFAWFITGEAEERTFKTPTEAYEAAIEYTLTKLI